MKKSILFVAALFAAVTINAKEIVIDLSTATAELSSQSDAATFSLADGVLTVNWTATAGWAEQGVAFALDNLVSVTNISFEYKGDGATEFGEDGVVLYPYIRDAEGKRWYKNEYWPNVKETEWLEESILPDNCPWDEADYDFGTHPFISLAFVVNPSKAGTGVFYLRNVKVIAEETGIANTAVEAKAVKIIRNGQVLFIRDGKTFNALGAIVAE